MVEAEERRLAERAKQKKAEAEAAAAAASTDKPTEESKDEPVKKQESKTVSNTAAQKA